MPNSESPMPRSSSASLRIVLLSLNSTVGAVQHTVERVIERIEHTYRTHEPDLIVLPELILSGYPPEDLLLRPQFIDELSMGLQTLASRVPCAVLLSSPTTAQSDISVEVISHAQRLKQGKKSCGMNEMGTSSKPLFNGAFLLEPALSQSVNSSASQQPTITHLYNKHHLPNYGVFDEQRYFTSGATSESEQGRVGVFELQGHCLGAVICEDLWQQDVAQQCAAQGAQLLISVNASPYHLGKHCERLTVARARVNETGCAVAYVNLLGGQDEVVFDGGAFVLQQDGEMVAYHPSFSCSDEHYALVFDWDGKCATPVNNQQVRDCESVLKHTDSDSELTELYQALVLATQDYVNENGFKGVVLGLSGGIDSALTLAVAVDALGADRVQTVMMPSRYTSDMSLDDAKAIANNFGVKYHIVTIENTFNTMLGELTPLFENRPVDTTEENLQARIRGMMLMALSNKLGLMVLTTGNKSEYAVGYSTLYGDMVGGFAPLKDVSKMRVFALSRWRNRDKEMIPTRIIERPPSAELAPDQKDEDSLPPYDVLDAILERYVERNQSIEQIVAAGFDEAQVRDTVRRVNLNEYKRRQSAPGVKVTRNAFGRERRYPITSGFDRAT